MIARAQITTTEGRAWPGRNPKGAPRPGCTPGAAAAWHRARLAVALLLALALAIAGAPARAETVADLASGHAVITGTVDPELTRGLRLALGDAIVRMTGDAALARDPRLASLIDDPRAVLLDLALVDRMAGIPVHDEQGTRERPHVLTARFDESRIGARLAALGIPLWQAERPLVEVRLTIETEAGRYRLARDGAEGFGQRLALVETAARRGLPIRLPGAGEDAPAPAPGEALLTGTLALRDGGVWDIDWTLRTGETETRWALTGVGFDEAMRAGVETTALHLARSDQGRR